MISESCVGSHSVEEDRGTPDPTQDGESMKIVLFGVKAK